MYVSGVMEKSDITLPRVATQCCADLRVACTFYIGVMSKSFLRSLALQRQNTARTLNVLVHSGEHRGPSSGSNKARS